MVTVPGNTFLGNIVNPSGAKFTADVRQYSGSSFSFQAGTCPQPFADNPDFIHCEAWCVNSCPTLHPNQKAAINATRDHLEDTIDYLDQALNITAMDVIQKSTPQNITGSVTVPTNGATLATVTAALAVLSQRLKASFQHPANFSVGSLNFLLDPCSVLSLCVFASLTVIFCLRY